MVRTGKGKGSKENDAKSERGVWAWVWCRSSPCGRGGVSCGGGCSRLQRCEVKEGCRLGLCRGWVEVHERRVWR